MYSIPTTIAMRVERVKIVLKLKENTSMWSVGVFYFLRIAEWHRNLNWNVRSSIDILYCFVLFPWTPSTHPSRSSSANNKKHTPKFRLKNTFLLHWPNRTKKWTETKLNNWIIMIGIRHLVLISKFFSLVLNPPAHSCSRSLVEATKIDNSRLESLTCRYVWEKKNSSSCVEWERDYTTAMRS